jgi:hypothetical protein
MHACRALYRHSPSVLGPCRYNGEGACSLCRRHPCDLCSTKRYPYCCNGVSFCQRRGSISADSNCTCGNKWQFSTKGWEQCCEFCNSSCWSFNAGASIQRTVDCIHGSYNTSPSFEHSVALKHCAHYLSLAYICSCQGPRKGARSLPKHDLLFSGVPFTVHTVIGQSV